MQNMDWATFAALVAAGLSALSLVGTLGVGGVLWGRLTEKVDNSSTRLDNHDKKLEEHETHLGELDVSVARLAARRATDVRVSRG